jgi:hypothetical protein
MVDSVLLTTSVWPSVWGWQVVENKTLVPNLAQKDRQKWLRNLVSWSETIVFGMPCKWIISLKNKSTIREASLVLWHGMKWAILENLSTTTKMLSCPLLVLGKPNTKYIEISSQGTLGAGRGIYKPCGFSRDVAFLHVVQWATNRTTSHLILGQKKWAAKMSSVFLTPKCHISPPPCASCNNNRWMELAGMHSLLARNTNLSLKTNLFHVLPSLQCSNTSLKSASCTYCSLIVSNAKILVKLCQ